MRKILRAIAIFITLFAQLGIEWQARAAPGDGAKAGKGHISASAQPSPGSDVHGNLSAVPAVQSTPSPSKPSVVANTPKATFSSEAKLELMLRRQEDLASAVKDLKPSPLKELAPAILSVLGVLFGAALANWSTSRLQRRRLEIEGKASRAMAGIAAASKLMDFRSRQLYELYAPLEALLHQNVTVRGELYRMLIQSTCSNRKYKMMPDSMGQNGESLFVISTGSSSPVPFRLIEQMSHLLAHHVNLRGTVNEIVSVNDQIVRLLHEKIGLVRSENRELSTKLGEFLAHQSVLRVAAKRNTNKRVPLPSYTTTFPRGLDRLVKQDADALLEEIKNWQSKTKEWMVPLELDSAKGAT